MEKESDIEAKYHKLAAEYSKVRSQATVLKKAVLDEQTKNIELNDLVKKHEQTMRKREQEMESLIFRNEQLTKRIMVLQQDLQINNTPGTKKGKNKFPEVQPQNDMSVLNEELQKKILENAQLFNNIAEKENELIESKEKIKSLENLMSNLRKELVYKEDCHRQERESCKKEIEDLKKIVEKLSTGTNTGTNHNHDRSTEKEAEENGKFWKNEAERWKAECTVLRSKPDSNDKLTNYYENQLSKILEKNVMLQSEVKTLWAENMSLKTRLDHITEEYTKMKNNMEISYEELITTNNNYKSQLDALTEHLAAQNEKITSQCDEIQILKHKLSLKK